MTITIIIAITVIIADNCNAIITAAHSHSRARAHASERSHARSRSHVLVGRPAHRALEVLRLRLELRQLPRAPSEDLVAARR